MRSLPVRLKSEIWVKAYIRRCATEGAPAVVVNRGDEDAGVIFIKIARLDGTADLYGPAPAGLVDRLDREWVPVRTAVALLLHLASQTERSSMSSYPFMACIPTRAKILLVDDVITSGGSKLEAIETLTAAGLKVQDVVVLIDREEGGREPLEARGYRVHSVLGLSAILDALTAAGRLTSEARAEIEAYRA